MSSWMPSWATKLQSPTQYNQLTDDGNVYSLADTVAANSASTIPRIHDKTLPLSTTWDTNKPERYPTRNQVFESQHGFDWRASALDKALVISAAIVPLVASTYLLIVTTTDWHTSGPLLSLVRDRRATAQIIVSIISAIMSSLNAYTVTKLIGAAVRIQILHQSFTLKRLKLIGAITSRQIVSSLPVPMYILTVAMALLFAIPTFIWTGALTPVLTNTVMDEAAILMIPQYSTNTNATWSNNRNFGTTECLMITTNKGLFSDCATNTIQSSLIKGAAQATSNRVQVHPRNDNTQYSFKGRSYGVGAGAGLVDGNLYGVRNRSQLLSYSYVEPGYATDVACFHNASSDWHLDLIQAGDSGGGVPYIYFARGLFPNALPGNSEDFFSVVALGGDSNLAAIAAKTYGNRSVILATAGSNYAILNGTQCEVKFNRAQFNVSVDVTNRLISVTSKEGGTQDTAPPPFDLTNGLAATVIDQINGLGLISTSLYTSIVGDALIANMAASAANASAINITTVSTSTLANSPEVVSSALSDSFGSMIDDILLFIGSSQFFVPNNGSGDSSTVDARLTVQAVQLGEPRYVFLIFSICIALVLAVVVEMVRTQAWKLLPRWDFADMTSLVLASATAGDDILNDLCQTRRGAHAQWAGGNRWQVSRGHGAYAGVGDDSFERLPNIRFRLGKKETRVPSAAAGQTNPEGSYLATVALWTRGAKGVAPLPNT